MNIEVYEKYKTLAIDLLTGANIILTEEEKSAVEVADFGLNKVENTGLQLVTYVNTEKCCAKDLVLLPNQTCPEHLHPPRSFDDGKEETFRCRFGKVYLYVTGEGSIDSSTVKPPAGDEQCYTVFNEIILNPGEQHTIYPNTLHWFKAGEKGAIISEFSTKSTDESDVFTDTRINRIPKITD